jgi:hypothetical protein
MTNLFGSSAVASMIAVLVLTVVSSPALARTAAQRAAPGPAGSVQTGPVVTLDPASGPPGTAISARGERWPSGMRVRAFWDDGRLLGGVAVQEGGTIAMTITVPRDAAPGPHTIGFVTWLPCLDATPRCLVPQTGTSATYTVTAAAGMFVSTPSGADAVCPDAGQWLALYWRGPVTPVLVALQVCPAVDSAWIRRGATWLGAAPAKPAVSDRFDLMAGELAFLHGAP